MGRRLPCPTNVGKALSSTLSIVTTGRGQRQGCAVPPILPQPSLRCAPLRPRQNRHPHAPLARPLRGPVTLTPSDRQPASVSTNRRRFTCTCKPHGPRRDSRISQSSKRRSQRTGCPRRHPGSLGSGPASFSRSGRNDHPRGGFGRPSSGTERRIMGRGLRFGSSVPEDAIRKNRPILPPCRSPDGANGARYAFVTVLEAVAPEPRAGSSDRVRSTSYRFVGRQLDTG